MTTRHEEIADQLTEEILRGRYDPGDRLPSERDLASRFDVNRGAVREAIKKLEQLGLAEVQPGGARVRPVEESTMEVLGHLLALDEIPDVDLVSQMMEVTHSLLRLAAESAVGRASTAEIDQARSLIRRLQKPDLSLEELMQTRIDLVHQFMLMSGNLVLRIISRSLRVNVFEKATPAGTLLHLHSREHESYLKQMDLALERRDTEAVISTLQASFELNREAVLVALREAHKHNGQTNGHKAGAGRISG